MIQVFHIVEKREVSVRRQFTLRPEEGAAIKAGTDPDFKYRKVADVYTDDLDTAYARTNSIDKLWTTNQDVTCIAGRHRSTSVGDALVDIDGQWWMVASFGFERIE